MRVAITRRYAALVVVVIGAAGVFGCFRGSSLLDPGNAAGYRAPTPQVSLITLAPTAVNGTAGGKVQLFAAPQNEQGELVYPGAVAWVSSSPRVATVSGTGMVALLHRGAATVTAIADGVTASVGAVVDPPPAAFITVSPATILLQAGRQAQFTATAFDATGAVDSGVTVNWSSSNTGVASVSSTGLVTAIAVGVATITASAGSASNTSAITVASAAPTVSSVSVSPASSTLYPGRTEQLVATLTDAAGDVLGGIPISWSSSSGIVATVSSGGTVTAQAIGSATITASAEGITGTATLSVTAPVVASVAVTPTSVTMSPGQTTQLSATAFDATGDPLSVGVSWRTSNSAVAAVTSSGTVTAVATGTAVITASASGVSGSATVTVESGPPGGFNEPPGMSMQVNTGPMTSIPSYFSIFSSSTPSSYGEWSGNLTTVPGGTGLRMMYKPGLQGGYSPVRFGTGVHSAGSGWYYQRMKIRFSPNWTLNGNVGLKFCEPRTQQTGSGVAANENDVISMHDFETRSTHAWFMVLLQGPNGQARNLFEQPQYNSAANLNNGAWRTVEVLFTPESTPGAGDGSYTGWVDGVQIAHYTNVHWLAPGNQVGWPYLMFDPTYGGGNNSPPATMYWDVDQLYVSTK